MLQKLSLFSLLLGALMVLSISSCSKPTNDAQAKQLIVGTWEPDGSSDDGMRNVVFTADGKVCGGNGNCDGSSGSYTITKDKITFSEANGSNDGTWLIVKLTKKVLVYRADGTQHFYHKVK